ncbi:hypothetical protein V6N13_113359 [Hibiscus sabdariffa]|uniref:Uncharacterized protein n=1 Tax=Hibiscus sabdariffa TaxID=183260 RepID=A0ABR2CUE8_9ROSI
MEDDGEYTDVLKTFTFAAPPLSQSCRTTHLHRPFDSNLQSQERNVVSGRRYLPNLEGLFRSPRGMSSKAYLEGSSCNETRLLWFGQNLISGTVMAASPACVGLFQQFMVVSMPSELMITQLAAFSWLNLEGAPA